MLLISLCKLIYCCNLRVSLKDVSNSVLVLLTSRKPALLNSIFGSVLIFSVGDITSLLLPKKLYICMLLVYTTILAKRPISYICMYIILYWCKLKVYATTPCIAKVYVCLLWNFKYCHSCYFYPVQTFNTASYQYVTSIWYYNLFLIIRVITQVCKT